MIEAEKADPMNTLTIARMRRLLDVDRRRFYEWRARVAAGPSPLQQRAADLTAQIRAFHAASDGTYGAPRIHADLKDSGVVVSRRTVAKLMQADGITGISPATYLHTGEGWAYLCVVRDGNTRRALGRTVGDSLHTDLVEDALRQAVALRGHLPRKVIFHAARRGAYTWVDGWYNARRCYSSIGYLSPLEDERRQLTLAV